MKSMKASKNVSTIVTYTALVLGSVTMIFPFLWMLLTSFKTQSEAMAIPPKILPSGWELTNFFTALQSLPFTNLYLNTGLMILFRVICAVVFSSMAGYAFAKLNFPGKNLLFGLVLMQMMLPSQIFIIPQYQMLAKMGATNSIFALVFPGLVSAFGTFFLRQAYMGIPNEIAEAAYLDGCNKWQTFVKVMFPLTGSSMAALAIFTAVFAYADLMWPLICNTDLNMMTLSAGLSTLNGQYTTNFPVLMAGSLLAMIPMLILYLLFQKQFIEGIAMTGGK
ncbi:MAG: carbohydrate ABC transporter permease [Gemmiger formicilis]|nr:carbohydrate ABC transporter permease [Gemmiger sp.]MCI6083835.1 carbohydrate ABC transporter permease [bacterium]MCI6896513.1 carbohydrate ABC transporter permease [Gemmiger formicilis]MCI6176693.1 carbohydrate ABC transporter permease [bacterium]MCI7192294.1 carbohydrate ABC transporter permease [bacterium]MCI7324870.1 carbohydrate ABC transporter permease [bacterium]